MTEPPDPPPEGKLIKDAVKTAGFSQREAARRAGISDARWRQIVSGYQTVSGNRASVRGPDDTLARMAHVVGVSAEQLEAVGRPAAAVALVDFEAKLREAEEARTGDDPTRVDERWRIVEVVLRQAQDGLSRTEYDSFVSRVNVFFAHTPQWHPPTAPPPSEAADGTDGTDDTDDTESAEDPAVRDLAEERPARRRG